MVQLFYYETRGISFLQLLRAGNRNYLIEFEACENWPYPTSESKWLLVFSRLTTKWCKVIQITYTGNKKFETLGHVTYVPKLNGCMFITGKFKKDLAANYGKPHFCLYLTTNIQDLDFHRGLLLTGKLERGNRKTGEWESTHYACIKRVDY